MLKNIIKTCVAITLVFFIASNDSDTVIAISKSDIKTKEEIMQLVKDLTDASNKHDIKAVASFYSSDFLSGDKLDKDQTIEFIKETWDTYPDIQYSADVTDVRFSDHWAALETHDTITATTAEVSSITDDKGDLKAKSHSIFYLRKIGKEWKIVGDFTYYEKAEVKFGTAKNLDVKFTSPEQVTAGEMYSGKIGMEVPIGSFAVGSITKEPIIYPSIKPKEKFRTISQSIGSLERVFESNETNNNELVTATIGITELTEDNQARPTVQLKGICIIGNRVNVVPDSTFDRDEYILTNKENLDETEDEITDIEETIESE